MATLQEKGYSEADIYREGEAIIGSEHATVARIERNRVVVNNNGVKECLELSVTAEKPGSQAPPTSRKAKKRPSAPAPTGERALGGTRRRHLHARREVCPG